MSESVVATLKMKDTNKQDKSEELPGKIDDKKRDTASSAKDTVQVDKENVKSTPEVIDIDDNAEGGESATTPKEIVKRKKIAGYIIDKTLRIRSYVRRRPIPLRRVAEIDIQCGSKSFLLQANPDFDEVIYCGNNDLVKYFLSPAGLKISDVNSVLVAGKYQARPRGTSHHWEHDYNPAPETDEDDEDFYDTIKNKKEKEKEAKGPVKKSGEIEFIKNPVERLKKFKAFKDGIFSKVKEIDSICGTETFVVILNVERDSGFYYGTRNLVSEFFTAGLKQQVMLKTHNVRKFEVEEVDSNLCCVPQCAVTRNTLSRWRMAAIDQFKFPPEYPLNLHLCPEEDRDKWIAEIDLDPAFKSRVVVCSLHFKDGFPTPENPYPTQLVTDSAEPQFFCGKPPDLAPSELSPDQLVHQFCASLVENSVLRQVYRHIDLIEERRIMFEKCFREREEKRRKDLLALKTVKFYKFTSLDNVKRRKRRPVQSKRNFKTRRSKSYQNIYRLKVSSCLIKKKPLKCKFCKAKFAYTKALFQHTRSVHVAPVRKKQNSQLDISNVERRRILSRLYPPPNSKVLDPRKKYVCAVCKSVCDLLGLFMHMKEVHHGVLCQYCLKLFKKVRDLDHHLTSVHKQQPRYYHNMEMMKQYTGTNYTLACGDCSMVMQFNEAENHVCGRPSVDCPWCKQAFLVKDELEGHIVNGWCPNLKLYDKLPSVRDIQVVYKILTGNMLEMPEDDDLTPADVMDTEINALLEVDIGGTTNINKEKVKEPVNTRRGTFSCFDKFSLTRYTRDGKSSIVPEPLLEEIPNSGTIFSGVKSKGINNNIKKEFKDKGRDFSIQKEVKKGESADKLDESVKSLVIQKAGKNFIIDVPKKFQPGDESESETENGLSKSKNSPETKSDNQPVEQLPQLKSLKSKQLENLLAKKEKPKAETRAERIQRLEFEINENLKKMRRIIDTLTSCLFCQQCKTVSVDAQFLLAHFHIIHSDDGVNEIMGENAQHCISRMKRYLKDIRKKEILFNYFPPEELFVLEFYRCSYCSTSECEKYEDLFKHTAVAHNTKVLTCNICHNIFLNYGSLISHVCSGPPTSSNARARFACKVCHRIDLSSFLDFQTHIRKEHNTCEICFQSEKDQLSLHKHCSAHDQDLMCMKCFVTFERVESFRKHMFWKHSHEQSECKSCHAPTWPHVYHFCLPDMPVPCHNCNLTLPNTAAFRVHNRQHIGSTPHGCREPNCNKSFISKSLLWKHQVRRHPHLKESVGQLLYKRKLRKEVGKFGTSNIDTLDVVYSVVDVLLSKCNQAIEEIDRRKPDPKDTSVRSEPVEKKESVLDAAIRSIMPESDDEVKTSNSSALTHPDRDAIQATIAGRSYSEDNSWQAGIDALLAGASVKLPNVPTPSDLPPDQLFQNTDADEANGRKSSDDDQAPVIGGLWNQDLMFVGKNSQGKTKQAAGIFRGAKVRGIFHSPQRSQSFGGPKHRGMGYKNVPSGRARVNENESPVGGMKTSTSSMGKSQWDLDLSESSDEESSLSSKKIPSMKQRSVSAPRPLLDHDYCYAAFMISQDPPSDTNEMDKIVSNVAFDGFGDGYEQTYVPVSNVQKDKEKKNKEKKKKKRRKERVSSGTSDSSASEGEEKGPVDMFGIQARNHLQYSSTPSAKKTVKVKSPGSQTPSVTPFLKRGPKPKYHTPDVAKTGGVTAGTARPSFDTDSSSHQDSDPDLSTATTETNVLSNDEVGSSDLETDFSASESPPEVNREVKARGPTKAAAKPALKLKIKLPPQQQQLKENKRSKTSKMKKRRRSSLDSGRDVEDAKPLSKKMRESLALNQRPPSSEEEDGPEDDTSDEEENCYENEEQQSKATDNEKLYCYCQFPHDDISEMIGCDAPDCRLEWFHFECVGIMVPPEGKWYCPECTKRYGLD